MKKSTRVAGLCRTVSLAFATAFFAMPCAADPVRHVDWLFEPQTDNKLFDNPANKGNCGAYMFAGLLGAAFSEDPKVAAFVLTYRQNDWARLAADFSKVPGTHNNDIAINLLLVGQCHNTEAQNEIVNNKNAVLAHLKNKPWYGVKY
ncbi:hypothetical protein [Asticcacaulis biprosthecium]|uniref:hypothetical protein n=1 Tax=Asticcacaulis biprosthecium TaxID=76891 RepID=UPI0012F516F2|nr:hypothetical protein [Asticcacaulis biprosthecium]